MSRPQNVCVDWLESLSNAANRQLTTTTVGRLKNEIVFCQCACLIQIHCFIPSQVNDAEKYKEEDEKQKERIAAKNSLESYAYNIKQSVEDEKLKDKISDDDKKSIMDKCNEVITWLDNNQVRWSLLV